MKKLNLYIFRQLLFSVIGVTLVLTCILWLAQTLRYIDFIANKGIPFSLFFQMILYLLPNLIVIILPIAILISVLFIYNKLTSDHELVVMQAAGISHWEIAKPAILISILFTFILYLTTLYFLPFSFRKHKDISVSLRQESLASLVSVGQFDTFGKYTVYARGQDAEGNFLGILIYNAPDDIKSTTYMAEKGILFNKEAGGRLLLINGNRQEQDLKTGKSSILYFDRYIIETKDKFSENEQKNRFLKAYERNVGDLFNPSEPLPPSIRLQFLSAAHQRIISPLFALAFGLLSTCFLVLGSFNRNGQNGKIIKACIFASFLEISVLALLHSLHYLNLVIPLSYGLVISTIITCLFLLFPWEKSFGNRFNVGAIRESL